MENERPTPLQARVFAPGMTCVYDQLFRPVTRPRWMAHRFRKDWEAAKAPVAMAEDPVELLTHLISGNLQASCQLFQDPQAVLRELGPALDYDILAVESRWLMYEHSLLSFTDWARLERGLRPVMDREVYYIDVDYAHPGSLFSLNLVKRCTEADIERIRRHQELKLNLLRFLSKFRHFTYIDVSAVAGYVGYRQACVDQIDHYSDDFRKLVADRFAADPTGSAFTDNSRTLDRLQRRMAGQSSSILFVRGLDPQTGPGGILLELQLVIQAPDPLLCPTEWRLAWRTRVPVAMDWSRFTVTDGELNLREPIDKDWLIEYIHSYVNIATMGAFALEITE